MTRDAWNSSGVIMTSEVVNLPFGSHVTKHANHYHLSAKRPSVLNDLFGPPPANEEFEYCSPTRWASR
jgi:hypothetical protein